jgi:AraC-like DNA-binding protein
MVNYYETAKAHPEIFKQLVCKELLFVHYDCPLEQIKTGKWSQHNYFMYILTGKMGCHTPTRSIIFPRGSAMFVKKGAFIMEKFFEEVLCIVTFFVPDSYLCSFMREKISLVEKASTTEVTDELIIPIKVNEILTAYIDSVLPYFYSETKPSEDLLELKFRELLLHIITDCANCDLTAYLKSLARLQANNLQQVMESNCLYNLSLSDYAKLCNRSLSSFKRDFQAIYKASPGLWILNKKLDYAHQLLLTTNKPVNDISFESGFESSTHFSRVFKNRFGKSPLQYRNNTIAPALSTTAI